MSNIKELRIQPRKHFISGIQEIFRTDRARLYQLIGIFQYTILYGIICFYLGAFLESMFPDADENKKSFIIAAEVIGQCFALSVGLMYIRMFVKAMPAIPTFFLPGKGKGVRDLSTAAYKFSEYEGELIVSIIFIGVQLNLLSKINILTKRVLKYFGIERKLLLKQKAYIQTNKHSFV